MIGAARIELAPPRPKRGILPLYYAPLFVFVYDHYTQDWNHCQEVTQDKQEKIIV